MKTILALSFLLLCAIIHAQSPAALKDYGQYNFLPGEHVVFEDNLGSAPLHALPSYWNLTGGAATLEESEGSKYLAILEYYTALIPKWSGVLPKEFTLEYDAWLDAGYDGNPGVEIHLKNAEDAEVVITPNRDHVSCVYPGGEQRGETPEAIRGERFYNRWNHIAIAVRQKSVDVFINQFFMFNIPDCGINVSRIVVTGNSSQHMNMWFKNFRLAKDIPANIAADLAKGSLVTHAIKFDVNRAEIKPESMGVLNAIAQYLKANPAEKLEIQGHTDSDGNADANLRLSQLRADAVKNQLVSMGIGAERLRTKGLGATQPLGPNTSAEGKANNRRVEFVRG